MFDHSLFSQPLICRRGWRTVRIGAAPEQPHDGGNIQNCLRNERIYIDPLLLLAAIRALLRAMCLIAARTEPVDRRKKIPEDVAVAQPAALFAGEIQAECRGGFIP